MIYLFQRQATPHSHEGQEGTPRSHESYIAELSRLYIYQAHVSLSQGNVKRM